MLKSSTVQQNLLKTKFAKFQACIELLRTLNTSSMNPTMLAREQELKFREGPIPQDNQIRIAQRKLNLIYQRDSEAKNKTSSITSFKNFNMISYRLSKTISIFSKFSLPLTKYGLKKRRLTSPNSLITYSNYFKTIS